MVFKAFVKPKAEVGLQAKDTYLPGAELPAEIRLTTQEEIKARELRAELVGEETYYVKETHINSKGHAHTRTVKKNATFASITQTVAQAPTFSQGADQKWNISLQVPPNAPPTCGGKYVDIRWTLKTVLDVPNRPDQSKEMILRVLCPPPRVSGMSAVPAEKSYDDVTMSLQVSQVACAGETLVGRLTLQVKNKLSPRSIRVELVRDEDAGAHKADEVIAKAEISGSASFNQQEVPSFDFTLAIPAAAPPTAVCAHSNLRWKVKAVIDRKMKTDFNVEQEVIVYNAPAPAGK